MDDWLKRKGRIYWYDQYALNEQETAFSNYDPDRIVDELCGTNADIIAVYAANQFNIAYYPSDIWPQHPNLSGRDYFGEVTSRLQERGKKVIAYINWLGSRHPDWNMIPLGREGDPYYDEYPLASWADPSNPELRVQNVPGGKWRVSCFNSPKRDQIVAVTREICERYRPDAFHLDMFLNDSVCVCDYCRPTLEKMLGTEDITTEAINEHWKEYIDWRCESATSLLAELSAILKEHNVAAAHNGQNILVMSPIWGIDRDWLPFLDVYLSEIFSDLNVASMTVKWHHALRKPSWELLTSTSPGFAHLSVPKATWELSAALCKANGCDVLGPCGVGAFPDTTSSLELLETVKYGFDTFMRGLDLCDGATSDAKIAVVFSWATRKYFRHGNLDWSEEIRGWTELLVEEHLPFDFVIAEDISAASDLLRYDLVIFPNSANLSDVCCKAVREYVSQGGKLLSSGETSLWNVDGCKLDDFALCDVFGVCYKDSVEDKFAVGYGDCVIPAVGCYQKVATDKDVSAFHVSVDRAGSVAGCNDPLPETKSEWPLVINNRFEDGHSIYAAFDLGRCYYLHGLAQSANFMKQLIDSLLPERQITVCAPGSVEVTVWKQADRDRTIVHLADRTQNPQDVSRIKEIIPVHDIELSLCAPCADPVVSCADAELKYNIAGDRIIVCVPRLNVYAAIAIEPGNNRRSKPEVV